MQIIAHTLTSKLVTKDSKLLEALLDKYSFYVPGYIYSPAYRKHRWDGRKKHFKLDGTFRTGLLDRVVKDLKYVGVKEVEITGKELLPKVVTKNIINFKYRDYQKEAVDHCLAVGRCLVSSPTGSGKTGLMAGIVKSLQTHYKDFKGVILFKEKGVLNQTYEFFKACGITEVGVNSGEGYFYGDIILSTVQSIGNILDTHLDCNMLMVDEVHQFGVGETTIAAIESFPEALYRYGFTATVPKEKADSINSRMVLEGAFGPVYTTRTMEQLVDDGSLSKPVIQIVENRIAVEEEDMAYQEVYDKFIVNCPNRNGKISAIVQEVYKNSPTAKILILVKNLKHVSNLKDLIPDAYTIEGSDDLASRYSVISKFVGDDNPSTIIGTKVMQTGISIDEITHMINGAALKGEIPTIQGLGRGVRKSRLSDKLYYYDFLDTIEYVDKGRTDHLNLHSKQRIKHYKELNLEINYVRI